VRALTRVVKKARCDLDMDMELISDLSGGYKSFINDTLINDHKRVRH